MAGGQQDSVPMPSTLREFHYMLGFAILRERLITIQPTVDRRVLTEAVAGVPEAQHIIAGQVWVSAWRDVLEGMAQIAERAEHASNPHEVLAVLTTPRWAALITHMTPKWFGSVVMAGTVLEGEPLLSFLRLLRELIRS